ncbi:hypothetical protein D915_001215 [Fasciola hepatica]|uniref:Secreted protein n=1 Tax=Fasciola hepatica TaxID=6192 RepID=A0A4E0RX81_FASHE|nr:hypothetical protein D915_001215 [Fasciola hepatica]
MARQMLYGLSVLIVLLKHCTQIESMSLRMLDREVDSPNHGYLTSSRVDSALKRCLQLVGDGLVLPGLGIFGQLDGLRECMMREFSSSLSRHHWSILAGLI